jgi:hypothetical protein
MDANNTQESLVNDTGLCKAINRLPRSLDIDPGLDCRNGNGLSPQQAKHQNARYRKLLQVPKHAKGDWWIGVQLPQRVLRKRTKVRREGW